MATRLAGRTGSPREQRHKPLTIILVAVRDPAARGQPAIRKAARLAMASGARLTLFHAFATPYPLPKPLPSEPGQVIKAAAAERRARLERQAQPLRKLGLKVDCEVAWDFPAAHAIVRQVLARKPGLVVAESHRRSRLNRWFLANTDWELIRECPCPVWFVKHERLSRTPIVLAAVDPSHAHAKPSGLDDRLLQMATATAGQLKGHAALVHVEDVTQFTPPIYLPALPRGAGRPSPAMHAATAAAIRRLGERHGIPPDARFMRSGVPAEVLASAARTLEPEVLVMGAISRSGLHQAFIGSTAEAVIDAVGCDVLIVKTRGFRTTVPRARSKLPTA